MNRVSKCCKAGIRGRWKEGVLFEVCGKCGKILRISGMLIFREEQEKINADNHKVPEVREDGRV